MEKRVPYVVAGKFEKWGFLGKTTRFLKKLPKGIFWDFVTSFFNGDSCVTKQ